MMKNLLDDLLSNHLSFEKEYIHFITTLYGVMVCNENVEHHLKIAKCLELMKSSTLIMDDFLDKSDKRNGIQSMYSRFGAEESVLIAEILKSSAMVAFFKILSEIPNLSEFDRTRCVLAFEDTYRSVCLGQLEDIRTTKNYPKSWDIKEKDYYKMIQKTTASFIQLPLLLGAIINHFNEKIENALIKYGLYIGMAYQIRDDVMDLIGDPTLTGKPLGEDIKERKIRLPIIFVLHGGNKKNITFLKNIYNKKNITDKDIHLVIEILHASGSITYCKRKIKSFCLKAIANLSLIPNKTIKKQLIDITDLLIPN